jgi:hypothetical protein
MAGGGADFRMTTDGDHFLLYYKTVSPVIVAAMPVPPDEVAGGGQEGLAVFRGVSMNLALIQPPRQGRFF